MFLRLLIFWLFLGCPFLHGQNIWRGIEPLVTTRSQAERKLGAPSRNGDYELDEGRVFIKYVEVACSKVERCDCMVPLGTVQFISIELSKPEPLKNRKLNLSSFKVVRDSHLPDIFTYSNLKAGVVYEVKDGRITHVWYYESEKRCNEIDGRFLKRS